VRVLIVDDEPLARRALRQLLEHHADVEIAGECADGVEALAALAGTPVDLALLDIRMPEISGLSVAESAGDGPLIVFVSAHDDYGIPAFDTGAADYLVKPVRQDRLDLALERVRARLAATRDATRYRETGGEPAVRAYRDRLVVRVGERDLVISVDDVDLIAADDVYASVHTGGHRYLLRVSLGRLARELDPTRFVRVHRSYIVPVRRVVAVHRRKGKVPVVELRNGATIPVSRRRLKELARLEANAVRG
jgi:two-component system LytT family response regulator